MEFLENPSQKWGDIKIPFFHRCNDVAYFVFFVTKKIILVSDTACIFYGKNIDAAFYLKSMQYTSNEDLLPFDYGSMLLLILILRNQEADAEENALRRHLFLPCL